MSRLRDGDYLIQSEDSGLYVTAPTTVGDPLYLAEDKSHHGFASPSQKVCWKPFTSTKNIYPTF